jgi:hypothetical protein
MSDHFDVAYSTSGVDVSLQNNGAAIVLVHRTGNYQAISPTDLGGVNAYLDSGVLHAKYTNRFDDPRYYSGDGVG